MTGCKAGLCVLTFQPYLIRGIDACLILFWLPI